MAGASSRPVWCSPTTTPCAAWPNGWRPPPGDASTTPRRTPTCGCPTAPACTRCSRPWRARAPRSRSGCRRPAPSGSTTWSPRAPCRPPGPGCCGPSWPRGARSWSPAAPAAARPRCWPGCSAWSTPPSAWCSSRTPPSCAPTTRTWWVSRAGPPTSRAPAPSTCAPWCARRCGCGPTGWWSARCAAPRSSTCSRHSTPATRAAAAPCTPTPPPTCRPGSRRWRWRPGSTGPPPTASWPRACTWCCTWPAVPTAYAASARSPCQSAAPTGWCGC